MFGTLLGIWKYTNLDTYFESDTFVKSSCRIHFYGKRMSRQYYTDWLLKSNNHAGFANVFGGLGPFSEILQVWYEEN